MRVRVALDVSKPLLHGKRFNVGTDHPYWIRFSYERFLSFCFCYGCLGYNFKECSQWEQWKNIANLKNLSYEPWLRAKTYRLPKSSKKEGRNPPFREEPLPKHQLPKGPKQNHT